ncbi:MAG: IS256 family transposase [Bacteroidetes bacterium]|nr:MAG: IS256 family transposase [Bacteroidota bacterium]
MHFTQDQISEILTQIAREKDGFRKIMTLSLESIMKAEREVHNQKEDDVSNGFRPRKVFGEGKMLEIRVPRSRSGEFYPFLLSILKDQQEESQKLVYSLYSSGLTTAQIGDIFEQVYGKHYSTSQVSHLMDYAREEVDLWLKRKLDSYYPIIYIDATCILTRRGDSVSKEAYYTILAVRNDKTREVLAVVNSPNESATIWEETFRELQNRGVQSVGLVVSDGLTGIENAVTKVFTTAAHQLCTVHLKRNVINTVNKKDKPKIISDLKAVFDPDNPSDNAASGHQRWMAFIEEWNKKYPDFNKYKDPRYWLYFTYLNYNVSIRRMIYTTNWIERLNKSYKRTTKMRASLPNADAVLFLLGSVAQKQKAYDYPITNFNNEQKLFGK